MESSSPKASPPGLLPVSPPLTYPPAVSPSHFISLKQCPLKAIWESRKDAPPLPAHPAAPLGSVAHALLAEAGQGRFNSAAEIERRWDVLVASAESDLAASWLTSHFVPLRDALGDYEVRWYTCMRRVKGIARTSQRKRPLRKEHSRVSRQELGFELPVRSMSGKAYGKIDRVIKDDRGVVLQDYKTGGIFSLHGEEHLTIKEGYRLQLLLYAAMYRDVTAQEDDPGSGTWPDVLEILPLVGGSHEVALDPEEARQVLIGAEHLLDTLIQDLEKVANLSTPQPEELEALASPGIEPCRFCQYRPVCPAYTRNRSEYGWGTLEEGEGRWPVDIAGTVVSASRLASGRWVITVQPDDDSPRTYTLRGFTPTTLRHPALVEVKAGYQLAAFNLLPLKEAGTFGESLLTTVYRIGNGEPIT